MNPAAFAAFSDLSCARGPIASNTTGFSPFSSLFLIAPASKPTLQSPRIAPTHLPRIEWGCLSKNDFFPPYKERLVFYHYFIFSNNLGDCRDGKVKEHTAYHHPFRHQVTPCILTNISLLPWEQESFGYQPSLMSLRDRSAGPGPTKREGSPEGCHGHVGKRGRCRVLHVTFGPSFDSAACRLPDCMMHSQKDQGQWLVVQACGYGFLLLSPFSTTNLAKRGNLQVMHGDSHAQMATIQSIREKAFKTPTDTGYLPLTRPTSPSEKLLTAFWITRHEEIWGPQRYRQAPRLRWQQTCRTLWQPP